MAERCKLRAAEVLPLMAFGVIAGVSFLAQPAKFLTPALSLADLVSVGSTLFSISHLFQLAVLLALALVVPKAKSNGSLAWSLIGLFGLTLALQQYGVMPPLEARLVMLREGLQPPPSLLHLVYIGLELLKLSALLGLAWLPPRTRSRQRHSDATGAALQ